MFFTIWLCSLCQFYVTDSGFALISHKWNKCVNCSTSVQLYWSGQLHEIFRRSWDSSRKRRDRIGQGVAVEIIGQPSLWANPLLFVLCLFLLFLPIRFLCIPCSLCSLFSFNSSFPFLASSSCLSLSSCIGREETDQCRQSLLHSYRH